MQHQKVDPDELSQLMCNNLNEGELKTLCFDLAVDYDSLPGSVRAAKARDLVRYFFRRSIDELVQALSQQRPEISWAIPEAALREHYSPRQLAELWWLISEQFDADSMRCLCESLHANCSTLPGTDTFDKAQELVKQLASQKRIAELVSACAQSRPDVSWQSVLERPNEQPPSDASPAPKVEPSKLFQSLTQRFDIAELRGLCFDLGIDYDDLAGGGREQKTRELIAWCARRQHGLPRLVKLCSRLRPAVGWTAPDATPPPSYGLAGLAELRRAIIAHLSPGDLSSILISLGVPYAPVAGDAGNAIRETLWHLARHDRLSELVVACSQCRPDIEWQRILEHHQASSTSTPQSLQVNRVELRQRLVTHFTEAQLRDLCFELGIYYDDLPGEGKAGRVLELIVRLERSRRLQELAEKIF